jgi:hypothetical protein
MSGERNMRERGEQCMQNCRNLKSRTTLKTVE